MKLSHSEAMKAKAAVDTAEAIKSINERLAAIEKMLMTLSGAAPAAKKAKKGEVEQAAPPQPEA